MTVDFSVFKNINLANTDNLLFLSIFLVIVIIVFVVVIIVIAKIIKAVRGWIMRAFNVDAKKPKFNQGNNTDWLHQSQNVRETVSAPKSNVSGGDFARNPVGEKKSGAEKLSEVDIAKGKEDKTKKDVAERLAKLKSANPANEDTLESKMPSRVEKPEDNYAKGLKALTKKRSLDVEEGKESGSSREAGKSEASDSMMFKGGSEVSREKLKHEMRANPKIWQASKKVGLTLSPLERANLVKEVFPARLGKNISKEDLKWSIKKLSKKMATEKNFTEHTQIKKKIKLFKKIGGVK